MLTLQVYALCVIVLSGVVIGVLYDAARASRPYLCRRGWAQLVLDFVFWGLAALVLGVGFMFANWGDLRGYLPIGACLGVVLYLYLASPVVFKLFRWLARLVFRMLWILTWPLRRLAGVIAQCAQALRRLVWHPPDPPSPPEGPGGQEDTPRV